MPKPSYFTEQSEGHLFVQLFINYGGWNSLAFCLLTDILYLTFLGLVLCIFPFNLI